MSIEETKSVYKMKVSDKAAKAAIPPEVKVEEAKKVLNVFDGLLEELSEIATDEENSYPAENKNLWFYPKFKLVINGDKSKKLPLDSKQRVIEEHFGQVLPYSEGVLFGVLAGLNEDLYTINLSEKDFDAIWNGREKEFEGYKSEFLTKEEVNDIYFENKNTPNYGKVFYQDKKGFIHVCEKGKDDFDFRTLNSLSEKRRANDILVHHFDAKKQVIHILLEENICLSDLSEENKKLFKELVKLYQDGVIEVSEKSVALTKKGMDAVKENQLTSIAGKTFEVKLSGKNKVDLSKVVVDIRKFDDKKELYDYYLRCDKVRADLPLYDIKRMEDPNLGHWELWSETEEDTIQLAKGQSLVARNPLADIRGDSLVGIDFGTKSTIVVYQDKSGDIQPLPVGKGEITGKAGREDFENPTVMQFVDLESFFTDYQSEKGRPHTKWNDLTISHTANNSLKDVSDNSDEFYSFLFDLKQWAGDGNKKVKIRDKKYHDTLIKEYGTLSDEDIDPIEIYAYYIGLYINNMRNGIYLEYLLSFPVTYEKAIRERILKSFEKGLKKSLPDEVLEDAQTMARFSVKQGASEPAAYAISALGGYEEGYGFDPIDDEKVFYGIFDFGGGTSDFDFGLWTAPEDEDTYDYTIKHFGSEGDKYLGGENLLQLLAYEVFLENVDVCEKEKLVFQRPNDDMSVSELVKKYINDSQEGKMNTKLLMEKLRPFWERSDDSEDYKKEYENEIAINLFDRDGTYKANLKLKVDAEKLDKVLEDRIDKGVKQFFEALSLKFSDKYINDTLSVDKIHIFLAGNSSKSPILKKVFDKYIDEYTQKMGTAEGEKAFEIFPPLGTAEAKEKQKERGVEIEDSILSPNGKTGVAFGLIKGRKGGRIEILAEQSAEDETKFTYYLGIERKKRFALKLSRESNYNEWYEFIPAKQEEFEIYYTSIPEATTGKLPVRDSNVKRKRCKLENLQEGSSVYIRLIKPDTIEYALGTEGSIDETQAVTVIFD